MAQSRNRKEGHNWERMLVQLLRNCGLYPHASTTRSANRSRDDQGIDICNSDEATNGRMRDDIQAKNTSMTPNIESILLRIKELDASDKRTPVVFWKKTGKSATGKFMEKGKFAACFLDDYIALLKMREVGELFLKHRQVLISRIREIDPPYAEHIEERLKALDLFHD